MKLKKKPRATVSSSVRMGDQLPNFSENVRNDLIEILFIYERILPPQG